MNLKQREEFIQAINKMLDINEKDLEDLYSLDEFRETILNGVKFFENLYRSFYKKDAPRTFNKLRSHVIVFDPILDERKPIIKGFKSLQKEAKRLKGYLRRMKG